MPSIERVKEIVIGAAIAVPVFFVGGKLIRAVKDEIWPSNDEDEFFEDDD